MEPRSHARTVRPPVTDYPGFCSCDHLMKIVVDRNIPGIDETFARFGEIARVDGRALEAKQLSNADALIIRSVTRVDAVLL